MWAFFAVLVLVSVSILLLLIFYVGPAIGQSTIGPTGASGEWGEDGPVGDRGPRGVRGKNGTNGTNGLLGVTGPIGPAGVSANTGATGAVGPGGQSGETGPSGENSPTGATGDNGPPGAQGRQGSTGARGATGPVGTFVFTAVGNAPNTRGGSSSGNVITLQPANQSNPGLLTAFNQTIGGAKTFVGPLLAFNLSGFNTGDLTLNPFGNTPNAAGATIAGQVLSLQVADQFNPGLVSSSGQNIGGDKTFPDSIVVPEVLSVGNFGAQRGLVLLNPQPSYVPTLLNDYETYSFTTDFKNNADSSIFAANVPINITRVGRVVTVVVGTFYNNITATTLDIDSLTAIPARFQPPNPVTFVAQGQNSNLPIEVSLAFFDVSGVIRLGSPFVGGSFFSPNLSGLTQTAVSYFAT